MAELSLLLRAQVDVDTPGRRNLLSRGERCEVFHVFLWGSNQHCPEGMREGVSSRTGRDVVMGDAEAVTALLQLWFSSVKGQAAGFFLFLFYSQPETSWCP